MNTDRARIHGLMLSGAWIAVYMAAAFMFGGDLFEHGIRATATGVAAGSVYTYIRRRTRD